MRVPPAGTTTASVLSPPPKSWSVASLREVLLEVLLGLVAGRGVVRHAGLHRRTHRRRDRPVLEVRLAEEPEIVDDHVGARGGEALDRLDHPEAVGDAREEERRARRDVVHDLEQRGTLVAAATPARAGGNGHGGQVAALLRLLQVVDAVGDDADDHAAAVEALGAHEVGARRRVTLGRRAADPHDGGVDRTHRMHPGERGDGVERGRIDRCRGRAHAGARHRRRSRRPAPASASCSGPSVEQSMYTCSLPSAARGGSAGTSAPTGAAPNRGAATRSRLLTFESSFLPAVAAAGSVSRCTVWGASGGATGVAAEALTAVSATIETMVEKRCIFPPITMLLAEVRPSALDGCGRRRMPPVRV